MIGRPNVALAKPPGTLTSPLEIRPVQPVERPPYRLDLVGDEARFAVEASDFGALIVAAALAVSDAMRPLGSFDVWTARRVSVRGATAVEVLERWLQLLLEDTEASGFLPALVEIERADLTRASGIHRGGIAPDDEGPPARALSTVVPAATVVEPGGGDRPWRAQFSVRTAAC
jgi:SHS2 domain-containing protein